MSFVAGDDVKEQVRQATDLVELVGGYLPLRRQGREYVALCPWHDDTRPSLKVNPQRQTWKCWVCNIGGDVFEFVMRREGVGFREALELLADRAGVSMARRPAKTSSGQPGDKPTLYRAIAWAEEQFHQCLLRSPTAEPARQYLEDRGVTPASVERFHLGYSPDSWQWLLDRSKATPFSREVLVAAGLLGKSAESGQLYDRFRGRLIFSIRDSQGRPIAFGGRLLPGKGQGRAAKYINSPETRLFTKSEHLYGLDLARDALAADRAVTIVEGYTDVVMAHQHGVRNVVAVLGTALGARHIRLLRRYADRVTLVLDGDEAGRRRTNEILELFIAESVDARVATLPRGLDPCEFLLERGAEAFQELAAAATDALEHRIRVATEGVDLTRDTHGANRALEQILATLAQAPRLQSGTTKAQRLREAQVLSRLARSFRVGEPELRARLSELRRRGRSRVDSAASPAAPAAQRLDPKEVELLEILTLHPALTPEALEQIPVGQLPEGPGRALYATYQRRCEAGLSLEFTHVLTELEDSDLKNILMQLEEEAEAKQEQVQLDAQSRLRELSIQYRRQAEEAAVTASLAALEEDRLDEAEQLRRLEELLRHERNRQGISDPTDG